MTQHSLLALPVGLALALAAGSALAEDTPAKAAAIKAAKPAATATTTATPKAVAERNGAKVLTPAAAQSTPVEDRRYKSNCHDKSSDA